jgi:hypothetical protein
MSTTPGMATDDARLVTALTGIPGLDPTVVSPGAIWDQSIGNRAVISISKRP